MMTTENIVEKKPVRYKCPECGHVGHPHDFEDALPGATLCMDGAARHYEVHFPGEEKPRKFDRCPSNAEIAAILAEVERSEGPKRRGRKPSDKVNENAKSSTKMADL